MPLYLFTGVRCSAGSADPSVPHIQLDGFGSAGNGGYLRDNGV